MSDAALLRDLTAMRRSLYGTLRHYHENVTPADLAADDGGICRPVSSGEAVRRLNVLASAIGALERQGVSPAPPYEPNWNYEHVFMEIGHTTEDPGDGLWEPPTQPVGGLIG